MNQMIVYSEIWPEQMFDAQSVRLRISINSACATADNLIRERESFLVQLSCLGMIQFDYAFIVQGVVVYEAVGLFRGTEPDDLKIPLVELLPEWQVRTTASIDSEFEARSHSIKKGARRADHRFKL